MWHIEHPDQATLDSYSDKLLPGLKYRIKVCGIGAIERVLLHDNLGKETDSLLKGLLVFRPVPLRDLSDSLMSKIVDGYSLDDLSVYAKVWNKDVADLGEREADIKKRYSVLKELEEIFGYDRYLGSSKKKTFDIVKRVGHNTCVYCNRQYTFSIVRGQGKNDVDRIARPALDHWYPKSLFPLMSLSYYNLIPSCTICNSSVKRDGLWTLETHIHPYVTKISEPGFSFRYKPDVNSTWEVVLDGLDGDARVKKTAEDLCLTEAYQCHSELEIADLLEIARKHNVTYLRQVYQIILEKLGNGVDKEKAYRLLFGTEMMSNKFKNRPFSKLKRDILAQLEKEEGIKFF